ncbi:MAG TPA: hypothetical protein VKP60_05960 [Magnetospirillaceae bacterium]|nr:hypothetical protein [Magnetospirillaceae bacterium]
MTAWGIDYSQDTMIDATPLTSRYKLLREIDLYQIGSDDQPSFQQAEMDRIYEKLIGKQIFTTGDALDKLAFADYCLTEEQDYKEASNLIRQVFAALLISLRNSRVADLAEETPNLREENKRAALAE